VWLATREAAGGILARQIGPDELFSLVQEVVRLADTWDAEVRKASPPEAPVACRSGCGDCCHISVAAAPVEVIYLAYYIGRHFSRARRDALKRRLQRAVLMTREERFTARLACPLLERDTCSIYEARPLNCRGLECIDAVSCRRASYGEIPAVPIYMPHWMLYSRVLAGLVAGSADAGRGNQQLDLFSALLAALEHPHPAQLWLSGGPMFLDCGWK
jgi:hypothetical protein